MEKRNDKYLVNISRLANIARENKWAIEYDADVDSFYWTKPRISKEARLMKLADDYALYITPDGKIEGVFIEYARNNFVEHNKNFKPLFDNLKVIDDNRYTLKKANGKKMNELLESMANKISAETVSSVLENNISVTQAFRAV